jgi:hypothetical protein
VFEFCRMLCLSKVRDDKDISGAVGVSVCFGRSFCLFLAKFLVTVEVSVVRGKGCGKRIKRSAWNVSICSSRNPFSTPPPPPPHPTRAIKSTKTPPISLESVLRACGLYELSFTRFGALFLAVLSCFSPDFVLLRPQPRRDRHPTFSRPSGTPPSFARKAHTFSAHHLRSATAISSAEI